MKAKKKMSRAEKAGRALGKSICEMIDLMYQKNTARNFLNGLLGRLVREEIVRRKDKAHTDLMRDLDNL